MYLLFQKRFAIYVCNMIITVRQSCMCVCVCVCVCVCGTQHNYYEERLYTNCMQRKNVLINSDQKQIGV